tara:strand:+ start:129 stop:293 length:165 start_codon:yes stop_codon:yes gene_type:complete
MSELKYYTRWQVIDAAGKVLFEGYYGDAEKFIKDNKLEGSKLDPKMYKYKEEKK